MNSDKFCQLKRCNLQCMVFPTAHVCRIIHNSSCAKMNNSIKSTSCMLARGLHLIGVHANERKEVNNMRKVRTSIPTKLSEFMDIVGERKVLDMLQQQYVMDIQRKVRDRYFERKAKRRASALAGWATRRAKVLGK